MRKHSCRCRTADDAMSLRRKEQTLIRSRVRAIKCLSRDIYGKSRAVRELCVSSPGFVAVLLKREKAPSKQLRQGAGELLAGYSEDQV